MKKKNTRNQSNANGHVLLFLWYTEYEPKVIQVLIPSWYVTLYGHWDFADVSKLKDFEMERLSWII